MAMQHLPHSRFAWSTPLESACRARMRGLHLAGRLSGTADWPRDRLAGWLSGGLGRPVASYVSLGGKRWAGWPTSRLAGCPAEAADVLPFPEGATGRPPRMGDFCHAVWLNVLGARDLKHAAKGLQRQSVDRSNRDMHGSSQLACANTNKQITNLSLSLSISLSLSTCVYIYIYIYVCMYNIYIYIYATLLIHIINHDHIIIIIIIIIIIPSDARPIFQSLCRTLSASAP